MAAQPANDAPRSPGRRCGRGGPSATRSDVQLPRHRARRRHADPQAPRDFLLGQRGQARSLESGQHRRRLDAEPRARAAHRAQRLRQRGVGHADQVGQPARPPLGVRRHSFGRAARRATAPQLQLRLHLQQAEHRSGCCCGDRQDDPLQITRARRFDARGRRRGNDPSLSLAQRARQLQSARVRSFEGIRPPLRGRLRGSQRDDHHARQRDPRAAKERARRGVGRHLQPAAKRRHHRQGAPRSAPRRTFGRSRTVSPRTLPEHPRSAPSRRSPEASPPPAAKSPSTSACRR